MQYLTFRLLLLIPSDQMKLAFDLSRQFFYELPSRNWVLQPSAVDSRRVVLGGRLSDLLVILCHLVRLVLVMWWLICGRVCGVLLKYGRLANYSKTCRCAITGFTCTVSKLTMTRWLVKWSENFLLWTKCVMILWHVVSIYVTIPIVPRFLSSIFSQLGASHLLSRG